MTIKLIDTENVTEEMKNAFKVRVVHIPTALQMALEKAPEVNAETCRVLTQQLKSQIRELIDLNSISEHKITDEQFKRIGELNEKLYNL